MAREKSGLKRKEDDEKFRLPDIEEMNRKIVLAQKTQKPEYYLEVKNELLAKKTEKTQKPYYLEVKNELLAKMPREYLLPEKFAQIREKVEPEFGTSAMKELAKKLGIKL